MISKQTIQKIAKLSNLEIKDQEMEQYKKELSDILDFFKVLEGINTKDVDPLLCSTPVEDVVFNDKAKPCLSVEEIIDQFPQKKGNYLKTKTIL
ncbi:MAG: Asp-tRNA(Asn)/Glu-tRNA(Gln) amidotransferase subunit GatC [Candidatus Moranbacteria bacterium]|nr:Asp-tRNA(Asn)/Glu-tRNA(Gln) amidotransferase subunit GatC [Candidatus Moranbacteria bacterium]